MTEKHVNKIAQQTADTSAKLRRIWNKTYDSHGLKWLLRVLKYKTAFLPFSNLLIYFTFYLRSRRSFKSWFPSQMPVTISAETDLRSIWVSHTGGKDSKHLGHDLLPPRVCVKEIWTWNIKRKLYESRIARDETRDSVRWDMGIRPKHLLRCPKICPCTLSLKTPVWSSTLDAALSPKI